MTDRRHGPIYVKHLSVLDADLGKITAGALRLNAAEEPRGVVRRLFCEIFLVRRRNARKEVRRPKHMRDRLFNGDDLHTRGFVILALGDNAKEELDHLGVGKHHRHVVATLLHRLNEYLRILRHLLHSVRWLRGVERGWPGGAGHPQHDTAQSAIAPADLRSKDVGTS